MPRVFISRELRANSPFLSLSSQPDWELMAVSLLDFRAIPLLELPVADWLFFYSPKGVAYFLAQSPLPAGVKIAAMGPGTATVLSAAGLRTDFIGLGDPTLVAADFCRVANGQRVAFVQARQSRQSVQRLLEKQIDSVDIVVYDNVPTPQNISFAADYLIFTSPLNFETYIQKNRIQDQQRVIGIGETTANAFRVEGLTNFRISSKPSEVALLACLLDWEQENAIA